jgi:hypothetical protein
MEGDSGGATAVFYGCRSEVGANRAPADDWSSSNPGVCHDGGEMLASTRGSERVPDVVGDRC